MVDIHADRMLIIDFGSQYTQLIARRIREAGVYCELRGHTVSDDEIRDFAPKGIILSGGPASVTDTASLTAPDAVFALGVPVLGICYGMQTMAVQLDGEVRASNDREFGYAELRVVADTPLLTGIIDRAAPDGGSLLDVWMSHGDQVMTLPPGFRAVATTATCAIAAMADDQRHWYGVQFHPEVTHTPQGKRLLARFVHDICGCAATWTADNIITDAITRLRAQIGDARVILGLSGGVDSSVVGALLHEAIGEQLTCVFVDNGLLRLGEGDAVMATFAEHMGVNVIRVNAEARFLDALSGISDPEEKRKTIGAMFVTIFEETAAMIDDARFLAQGTIYPDVIESAGHAGGAAKVIKSHHNVGGLPATMRLQLVEPLRELFKDEVRRVGIELGLPAAMVQRHPFPGPGLGVRILGEVSKAAADTLRQADAIFIETLRAYDWYDRVSQAFAVFLPVKSVGVTGDYRHYAHVVALRAVETTDFMTARWAQLPYALLDEASHRIINSVAGVARVVYDISGKPPATIEWE